MMCTKFQVKSSKTVTDSFRPDRRTDRRTDELTDIQGTKTGETRSKPEFIVALGTHKYSQLIKNCLVFAIHKINRKIKTFSGYSSVTSFSYKNVLSCLITEGRPRGDIYR